MLNSLRRVTHKNPRPLLALDHIGCTLLIGQRRSERLDHGLEQPGKLVIVEFVRGVRDARQSHGRSYDLGTRLAHAAQIKSGRRAVSGTRANFDRFDTNQDDFLTPEELNADIQPPTVLFSDEHEIEIGGYRVRLLWAGNRQSNDLIDVYFPDHWMLFAGDYVWINRMCCNFAYDERPMSVWIESLRALEELDFDILINSHFASGTKDDLVAFRLWLETLEAAVSDGIANGMTLKQMQEQFRFDAYSDWAGYAEQLPTMIESAYLSLTRYSDAQ